MKIYDVSVSEILDSRREKTIEVTVRGSYGISSTKIPSGRSRGKNEAITLGAEDAEEVLLDGLRDALKEEDFVETRDLDEFLIEYDGTDNKSQIGGDLSLGISISFARILAGGEKKELWEKLREEFFDETEGRKPPRIFSNVINGGAHAKTNLDIQEYQIVSARDADLREAVEAIKSLYKELGELLARKYRKVNIALGDEQGYATDFGDSFEPIEILSELLSESKGSKNFAIGIDAAASNFYTDGFYKFGGKKISTKDLCNEYEKCFSKYPLLKYIEDPFGELDEDGFGDMLVKHGAEKLIIGDDLTTTSALMIEKYANRAINGVIIKPNQIGTVTETCEAMLVAEREGLERIVSHRSGEVDDPFLIHFARAGGAEGVKIGVPVIEERISKFDELIRVYS